MDDQQKADLERVIGKDDGDMNDQAMLLEGLLQALMKVQSMFSFHHNQTSIDGMIADKAHGKRAKHLETLLGVLRAAEIEALKALQQIETWKVILLETLDMRQRHCSMCKKLYVRKDQSTASDISEKGRGSVSDKLV